MFDSKISKAPLMKEFMVPEKTLHLAVSGRKYDLGKKFVKQKPCDKPEPKKKKPAKMDEPKTDEVVKIPEDMQPSPEDLGEPQSDDTDDDDDDDSLPDLFSPQGPKKPKTSRTKEDQDEENAQTQTMDTNSQSSFPVMKKLPNSRHSQQRNHHGRSHPTNNYSFLFYL